jgi:Transglycosylase-like domain
VRHAKPFVAMAPTKTGRGYYLLGADGGVFAFGDAHFSGSAIDGIHPATGIAVPVGGRGYQVVRPDGTILGFGGARSIATAPDKDARRHPVVAIAAHAGGGAWLARGFDPPPAPARADLSRDPFLRCTRAHESDLAGGYRAVSAGGRYRGAYQFLRSTWNNVARRVGRGDLVGVDPALASPADQDALALALYHWQGPAPWGGRCRGFP